MIKKAIFSLLLAITCAFCAFGQTAEAQKVDEFGTSTCHEYRAIIDILMLKLNNSPGAKGYVFVYEGDLKQIVYDENYRAVGVKYVSSAKNLAKVITGYFENHRGFRKFPAERFVFINGGFREKFTVELWVVPDGATPPEPSPTLKKIKQKKASRDADKFCSNP